MLIDMATLDDVYRRGIQLSIEDNLKTLFKLNLFYNETLLINYSCNVQVVDSLNFIIRLKQFYDNKTIDAKVSIVFKKVGESYFPHILLNGTTDFKKHEVTNLLGDDVYELIKVYISKKKKMLNEFTLSLNSTLNGNY